MSDTFYYYQQLITYLLPQVVVSVSMVSVLVGVGIGFLRKLK